MQNNSGSGVMNVMVSGYNAGNAGFHRWQAQYRHIRQAMIFIDRVQVIGNPGEAGHLSQADVARMRDEARFLMAWCYFTLLELYGPIPIIREIADPNDQALDYERRPLREVIDFIDELLAEVIASENLPSSSLAMGGNMLNELSRPTIVGARALRARLWVYAASPLFNGGFAESLTVTNHDGTRLFPDHDPTLWVTARNMLEDFFTHARQDGHALLRVYNPDGTFNPHQSVYQVFQGFTMDNPPTFAPVAPTDNRELIWSHAVNIWSGSEWGAERASTPVGLVSSPSVYGTIGVSQETVDAFFMANGLDIRHPQSGYSENAFVDVFNPTNNVGLTDANVFSMFANREPRFYASVIYQGQSWPVQPRAGYRVEFDMSQPHNASGVDWPRGGYLFGRFKNRGITLHIAGSRHGHARPSIIFRMADFYLYYAEVLNEINPGDPRIIEYLDAIRERAGIPGYRELSNTGVLDIIGDQQQQRWAIYRERRVELLGEGQRWFDLRRWMIASPTPENRALEGDMTLFTGLNMRGRADEPIGTIDSFFTRTVIEQRIWRREKYWHPIPQNEINNSRLLVQNPLWEGVQIAPPTPED
jgi:hypothetical protein